MNVRTNTPRRGRPPIYVGETAIRIEAIIRETDNGNGANLTHARSILNARNGVVGLTKVEQGLAVQRRAMGFVRPLGISQPTITKLASDAGINVLPAGRPALVTA